MYDSTDGVCQFPLGGAQLVVSKSLVGWSSVLPATDSHAEFSTPNKPTMTHAKMVCLCGSGEEDCQFYLGGSSNLI